MAFHHHIPTFLRSAIARDPFCHGGLITPEDVLRLEAKFPTLFDKPALVELDKSPRPQPPPTHLGEEEAEDDDEFEECKEAKPLKGKKPALKSTGRNLQTVSIRKCAAAAAPAKENKVTGQNSLGKRKVGQEPTPTPRRYGLRPPPVVPPKKPSQFHKKCIEKTERAPFEFMGQSERKIVTRPVRAPGSGAGTTQSKLTRPAQSFSLEDLRATLKQVMEEDELHKSNWLRRSDNGPSPYTEDLVKKFLGWKMNQMKAQGQGQKGKLIRNVNTVKGQGQGQGDQARMKALTDAIAAYHDSGQGQQMIRQERNRLTSAASGSGSGRVQKEKAVPRIKSAPGFLRGISELPPVPNYQQKRVKDKVKGQEQRSSLKPTGDFDEEGGRGDGESRRKHVTWEEKVEVKVGDDKKWCQDDRFELEDDAKTGEEEVIFIKARRSGMRGTDIRLRSDKKPVPEPEVNERDLKNDERFKVKSNYQDLLAARSEKTRYEVKGFLRKQENPCNFYKKQLERERKERKDLKTKQGIYFLEESAAGPPTESSSEPSENFTRKMLEMGQRSKEETNKCLEIMAKELVYLEVLHQINELKQEQKDAEEQDVNLSNRKLFKPKQLSSSSSTSSSPREKQKKNLQNIELPKFLPTTTTTDQDNSETGSGSHRQEKKSSPEISLKTPELTPPSAPSGILKRQSPPEKKPSPQKIISLRTPDLSPSPKRLIAAIKERKELERRLRDSPPQPREQLDTDCSEMSDFVFSEPSKKEEKIPRIPPSVLEEESVPLETPQLSNSQDLVNAKDDIVEPVGEPPKTPEKDESTLSGVPSTFLETPTESPKSKAETPAPEEDKKSQTIYSDDFTPEKASSSGTPEVPAPQEFMISDQDQEDEDFNSDVDPNDKLNTSGETVIDLLSDGEFIGPSYRSPGELSWRQQTRQRQRSRLASSSNPSLNLAAAAAEAALLSSRQRVTQSYSFEEQEESFDVTSSTMKGSERQSESGENEDDDRSISVLSFGAQISPGNVDRSINNISLGEYLHP